MALRSGTGRRVPRSAPLDDRANVGDVAGPAARGALRLPLLLGALGAFAIAFSGIYVRLSTVAPATSAVFRCLYAVPVLALLARRETRAAGRRDVAHRRRSLAAGVAFAVDLVAWHYAIDVVGAGLATVLANVQVVIVGLVAWVVLGERPSRATIGAVPVMLFGVVLISGVIGADAYGDDPGLGAALGLLAAVAYSGYLLLLRAGNADQEHKAGALLDATVVGGLGAAVAGLALGDLDLVPSWPEHGWLIVLALNSQVVGWLLISYALPRLPAIVTSVLLLLQPVSAVLLGIVLLGEAPSVVQLGGVGLVLAGIVVSTASDAAAGRDRQRSER
ncbi:MAG TPA: DMT family transporter [Euzebyales bacterium]|nr:DMT family transporter [Euzebyales bacterium]